MLTLFLLGLMWLGFGLDGEILMGDVKNGYQATPNATLEQQMMDACAPKNEREWWAFAEIGRLRAEVEALRADADDAARYRYVNGPNGWIEKLRVAVEDLTADRDSWRDQASARAADAVRFMQERAAARAEVEALRADALKQVDCRQCKHATNRGCHSTALCERGELFEATPPWQFYDAARAAQGGET